MSVGSAVTGRTRTMAYAVGFVDQMEVNVPKMRHHIVMKFVAPEIPTLTIRKKSIFVELESVIMTVHLVIRTLTVGTVAMETT